jgi:hypothetical protein
MDLFVTDGLDRIIDIGDILAYSGPCHQIYFGRVIAINEQYKNVRLIRTNGSKPTIRSTLHTMILAKFNDLNLIPKKYIEMFDNPVEEESS